ncbi:MAG: sugar nucleotide-binding protein [Proteobacteria bacterium]|nr:sugar nucleotide-binding protein [Pseudomonadota bacterium]
MTIRDQLSLVVGADGGIGQALCVALRKDGRYVAGTSRRDGSPEMLYLDLAGDLGVFAAPAGVGQAFLCAAVTATAQCRMDPAGTACVNVDGTVRLAEQLVRAGVFVVFPSTNMVFDGALPRRAADDARCPLAEYGRQKARAEELLLALGGQVAVVRLTKVLAPGVTLFSGWAEQLQAGRIIRPFSDMPMAPVPLDFVVGALLAIAASRKGGLWQISASRDVSYAEAALRLAARLGADLGLVRPVSWREAAPDMEHVPAHTSLDASLLEKELGLAAPDPLASLDQAYGAYE